MDEDSTYVAIENDFNNIFINKTFTLENNFVTLYRNHFTGFFVYKVFIPCFQNTSGQLMSDIFLDIFTGNLNFFCKVKNLKNGSEREIPFSGLFVSIGREPATELVTDQLTLDSAGYIAAGEDTLTNIPGVFAVGDVRSKALRQVVTAVADGAMAAQMAEEFLLK